MQKKDEPQASNPGAVNRRDFLKIGGAMGLGAAVMGASGLGCATPSQEEDTEAIAARIEKSRSLGPAPENFLTAAPMEVVRIGFVGVGGMGTVHVRNLVRIPGAQITAICDIREEHALRARDIVVEAGHPEPTLYTRGETDFQRMCQEEELDLVFNATPWEWHVPIALAAMENDKHTASEVPFAYTMDDCWAIVEAAEKYRKHCVMMENVNYNRPELMVLNMVRQGLFGEVLHGECGYLHDLRAIKFSEEGEGLWRREHSKTRNGNLYPTHGLGPIANCMNINRGDKYEYLVSMSGPSRGLQRWAEEHYPVGHPKRQETYALGDINVSLIKTTNGKTIFLSHDTNLPRPYSRINLLQGTHGIFQGYPNRVYIEGRSPEHQWEPIEPYMEEFAHPLWKAVDDEASGIGHGGMDFLEDYRLIKCLREGLPTDMNVYDAASMSVICALTEYSVANRSRPVDFPDFTRGQWKNYPEWGIVTG